MWTKSARQAQVVELEQLGTVSALGRYGNTAIRGLATGLVIGGSCAAFLHYGFFKGVIIAAVLIGLQWLVFKKR